MVWSEIISIVAPCPPHAIRRGHPTPPLDNRPPCPVTRPPHRWGVTTPRTIGPVAPALALGWGCQHPPGRAAVLVAGGFPQLGIRAGC